MAATPFRCVLFDVDDTTGLVTSATLIPSDTFSGLSFKCLQWAQASGR